MRLYYLLQATTDFNIYRTMGLLKAPHQYCLLVSSNLSQAAFESSVCTTNNMLQELCLMTDMQRNY